MALAIKPTPILEEKESEKFLLKIKRNLTKPTYKKNTSKIFRARTIALKHAILGTK